jgi:putative Holliday junction resolvase
LGSAPYPRAGSEPWVLPGQLAPAERLRLGGRIFVRASSGRLVLTFSSSGMARTLAIDYGNKRVGLAVTDPLGLIATPLDTIHSKDLVAYVLAYHQREPLKAIVVGMPRTLLNEPTDSTSAVVGLLRRLRRELPELPVHEIDERFTSRMAKQAMLAGGLGRKARQDKAMVDKVSATLILQSFLESPLS